MLTFLPGPEPTPVTGMSANDRPKSVALRLTPALVTCLPKVSGAHLSNLRGGQEGGGTCLPSVQAGGSIPGAKALPSHPCN